jgi:hypothetical protein
MGVDIVHGQLLLLLRLVALVSILAFLSVDMSLSASILTVGVLVKELGNSLLFLIAQLGLALV